MGVGVKCVLVCLPAGAPLDSRAPGNPACAVLCFKKVRRSHATGGLSGFPCCRVPPSNRGHLSLQAMVDLAKEVGGADHGFR